MRSGRDLGLNVSLLKSKHERRSGTRERNEEISGRWAKDTKRDGVHVLKGSVTRGEDMYVLEVHDVSWKLGSTS